MTRIIRCLNIGYSTVFLIVQQFKQTGCLECNFKEAHNMLLSNIDNCLNVLQSVIEDLHCLRGNAQLI